jgi:multiple sugar transport system permease protein
VTTTIPERHPGQEGAGPSPRPGAEPKPVSPGRRKLRPYILSVPAVAVVIGILYPFVIGVYYAFLNYSAVNPDPVFVGLDNFALVLSSGEFWHSVLVTLTYAIAATLVETVLGIGIALLLNRSSIVGKIFEKVLILPLMIAPVIAAVVWKLMFNPQFGVLNHVLGLGSTFECSTGSGRCGRRSWSTSGSTRRSWRSWCSPGSARCRRSRSKRPTWTARAGSTCSAG